MSKERIKGISVKKNQNFSKWFLELVQKAELADTRYKIKGMIVYMPWATITIRKMYEKYQNLLEKKGHLPITLPSLIPESNFKLESDHVEGFTPEVFWVTHGGKNKLEERLALRPTSETAFYQMYSLWIRSYKDLPFKRYQSCQVWRHEGKATFPFFRAREFHWIESHNVFASKKDAMSQINEDMETTYEMLQDNFCIPIIFFQRPHWDKFAGTEETFAADALTQSGKVIQLPSTHYLGKKFSKPFNVTFLDKNNKEQYGHITCYGPAISRIYGGMVAILGDDNGLVLPWDLSPLHVVIIPIYNAKTKNNVMKKAKEIEKTVKVSLKECKVKLDDRDEISPGEKFNEWELRGVPLRIEIGPKDIESKKVVAVNRIDRKKQAVKWTNIGKFVNDFSKNFTDQLKKKTLISFESKVKTAKTIIEIKKVIDDGMIACTGFCSLELSGKKCAESIKEKTGAEVRGKRVGKEKNKFKQCCVCGKPSKETVYIAKSY